MIFTFGSNLAGVHGAGAAKEALLKHGAEIGRGVGHVGNSYAIPTKNQQLEPLYLPQVEVYVRDFIFYAKKNPYLEFQVTQIGCGLAGFKPEEIAPMFRGAPTNCYFDSKWKPWLGESKKYWGTF